MWRSVRLDGRDWLGNADIFALRVPDQTRTRFFPSRRLRHDVVAVGGHAIAGDRGHRALIGVLIPCIILAASVTHASDQVTVAVTNRADLTVSAGESVSDGGDCTITNNSSTDTVTITSITYTLSNPGLFSSTTLTLNGNAQTTSSPASSNSVTFDVSISPGASVDCTLSADVSSSPTSSSAAPGFGQPRPVYASIRTLHRLSARDRRMAGFGIVVLGVVLFVGNRRPGLLVVLTMGLVLTTTEVGCGNGNSGTSTQIITSIAASSSAGTTVSGLPATLGTMTLSGTNSGS
jgi:hypothetical protein